MKTWTYRKRIMFLAAVLSMIWLFSGMALALYMSSGYVDNQVKAQNASGVYIHEVFNEHDRWLPGETKEKVVNFGNMGELAQVIRFKPTASWLDKDGNPWTPTTANPVILNWTAALSSSWTKIGDWYYYKAILQPGTSTAAVLNSVTFSQELTNDGHVTDNFSETTYKLVFTMESLEVSTAVTAAEWGVNFTGTATLTWTTAP